MQRAASIGMYPFPSPYGARGVPRPPPRDRNAPMTSSKGPVSLWPGAPEDIPAEHADMVLVRRIQEGDESAFRHLFDRYARRAYAIAYGVVKNKSEASDIVQDAFVRVHRHIGTFEGGSSFYTWLYRIVMNLAIDVTRRAGRGKSVDYDDGIARTAEDVEGDGSMLPVFGDANPSRTAERRELNHKLQEALDSLPEYHREVILLREVEGLSYEDIAKVLRVPKGTIMSRLFHARRKMQEALAGYLEGDLEIAK